MCLKVSKEVEAEYSGRHLRNLYKLLDSNTQCSYQLLYPENPQNLLQQLDQKADINYWQKTLQQSFLSLNGSLKKHLPPTHN